MSSSPVETVPNFYLYVRGVKRIGKREKKNGNEVGNFCLGVVSGPFGSRGFWVVITLESQPFVFTEGRGRRLES